MNLVPKHPFLDAVSTHPEHTRDLLWRSCILGRSGAVDMPWGLIVPAPQTFGSAKKLVHVVCRGRPLSTSDISSMALVRRTGFGDMFQITGRDEGQRGEL